MNDLATSKFLVHESNENVGLGHKYQMTLPAGWTSEALSDLTAWLARHQAPLAFGASVGIWQGCVTLCTEQPYSSRQIKSVDRILANWANTWNVTL